MSSIDYFDMLNMTIAELKKREYVGAEALRTMERFRREELEKYAQRIIPRLDDDDAWMRIRAINALGELEAHVLAKYAQNITPMLDDRWTRMKAIEVLGKLEPRVLAKYAQHIIPRLEDDNWIVRYEATKAFGSLEPQVLARYAEHIIPRLGDDGEDVRGEAFATLEKLPLLALVPHRHRLAAAPSLRGRVWLVRWRQLFWGQKLLLWWLSVVLMPGSRRAIATAREFYARAKRVKVG